MLIDSYHIASNVINSSRYNRLRGGGDQNGERRRKGEGGEKGDKKGRERNDPNKGGRGLGLPGLLIPAGKEAYIPPD